MAILITWFILFGLMILSFQSNGSIPLWIPFVIWSLVATLKAKEKWGNYKDWEKKNGRDEKIKLEEQAEQEAQAGTVFSSGRQEREQRLKEDFEDERRKAKRKFQVDLIEAFFLK